MPDYAGWPLRERVAAARQLLQQMRLAEIRPPAIELRYNSDELHSRIAIAVARMWKESLGIEVALRAEDFKVLLEDIDRGDVDVFRASWVGDYDDAFSFLPQVLRRAVSASACRARMPVERYDELLSARARNEGDLGRRRELLQDAEAAMLADQPVIPLYFYVAKHLVDPADILRLAGQCDEYRVQQEPRQTRPRREMTD